VALVEALIGKGCSVRIFDPNVQLAALIGANRRYIEKEIPHISSLMCDDLDTLVQDVDVLVIGGHSADAERAIALRRENQDLVDLTRATARTASNKRAAPPRVASLDELLPAGNLA